ASERSAGEVCLLYCSSGVRLAGRSRFGNAPKLNPTGKCLRSKDFACNERMPLAELCTNLSICDADTELVRLLRVEARGDQSLNTVDRHRPHESPLLRRLCLTGFRKHVVNPSRSFGFGGPNDGIVKQLAVGVFLTAHVGSLARGECRIQQHIALQ